MEGSALANAVEADEAVLAVENLSVDVKSDRRTLSIVRDVSFTVGRGETVGLVGESGCGKTMTSLAIMQLLPRQARIAQGSVRLGGQDLTSLPRRTLEDIRGQEIAMIFQDAMRSLNPAFTVGDQIGDVMRRHKGLRRAAARKRAIELLDYVGIPRAAQRIDDYPHMFSGGMAQRVMIASAISCEPKVLIADEPTTALDVTIQSQVLRLLRRFQLELGLGLVFITHDLGVVAEVCDRVAVMYAGQIVEQGEVVELFERPQHPYTAGLLGLLPLEGRKSADLVPIPGTVPMPSEWPAGCRFAPRCPHVEEGRCAAGPVPLEQLRVGRTVRCVRHEELALEGVAR